MYDAKRNPLSLRDAMAALVHFTNTREPNERPTGAPYLCMLCPGRQTRDIFLCGGYIGM